MGDQISKREEKPRYRPSYGHTKDDTFLGYADELDVWVGFEPDTIITAVGPNHRRCPLSAHNFDGFEIIEGNLKMYDDQHKDLHIDLHDMCLIYALCAEHGLFEENKDE